MNNVVLMMNGQERVWLGRLTTDEEYTALLEWGRSIATGSPLSEIPNLLQAPIHSGMTFTRFLQRARFSSVGAKATR